MRILSANTGGYFSRRHPPVGYSKDELSTIKWIVQEKIASLHAEGRHNIRAEIGTDFPQAGCKLHEDSFSVEVFLPDRI